MALANASLDDKYMLDRGRVFLTGVQALVRLPMIQRRRDLAAGQDTACYISGYRGSPLGVYDQQLWRAGRLLKQHCVHFQPGVNEELAATAVWGSQQTNLFEGARHDGVFGIWYGKGPGVDRSGDVFKHANFAGTARWGGVLAMAGDDHVAKSSTVPHQSEYAFVDASIPVLNPAGVQDTLDFGLLGIAMGRFSGCWVGFKTTAEIMDSSASVEADPDALQIVLPEIAMPPGGLNIRWPDDWLEQEARLHSFKLPAARAFAHANGIDRIAVDCPEPRLVIVTTGKSYLDVRQALDDLGIDADLARDIGLRVYKVGMPWPLEPRGARAACDGAERVLVVEEKRSLIEWQLKDQLYDLPEGRRPRIEGKQDDDGKPLFQANGELLANDVALAIADRVLAYADVERIKARRALIQQRRAQVAKPSSSFQRTPYFCSGCPHNTSTRVPEGSRALAGIGCHFMASWMPERHTETFTQMGGEGVTWVGQAQFTDTPHVFANLGDGTYNHSGSLAVRMAVASGTTMTYKILFNDAVAMTGGQPSDNGLTPWAIARQVAAEGVARVDVVTDDPEKYPSGTPWPEGTRIHHRDDLDEVQRDLREVPGVTVLIYDQTCAAEKRRRRKRGTLADPEKRIFINELVCEGCGDCGVQSNCVSILPVETEFGRKRQIDQSSCNKDYSCVKGFCPSFVNVIGGKLRKSAAATDAPAARDAVPDLFEVLPDPALPSLDEPYGIIVTGIGGTGVVTIGALLGMAAHLEGKGTTTLDMIGLAQKGGAVISHVKIARAPDELHAVRIATGAANLMLACDMATAVSKDGLATISRGTTHAVVNTQETMTGRFTQTPDMRFPADEMKAQLRAVAGDNSADFVDANRIATRLLGDSIAANLFMLGYAYQKGLVPLSAGAIERAIELNAVAVEFNKQAFLWGRRTAHDRETVERLVAPKAEATETPRAADSLEDLIARREAFLTAYQDAAYAARYRTLVERMAAVESARSPGSDALARAVARYAFKLMAIKDEYEVARLYTDGGFRRRLAETFTGDYRIELNLAPPSFAPRDPQTGELKKVTFGSWILPVMGVLAKLRGLRGSAWDLFGRTEERRTERRLRDDYFALMDEIEARLSPETHGIAVELASVPEQIRGYGHVKDRHVARAEARKAELLAKLRDPEGSKAAAE